MTINEIRNGDLLTVCPEGRLDTLSSPELDEFLSINYPSIGKLTLDFEKVDYISSAGLRVLIIAAKTMSSKGRVRILNASPLVIEVFKVTGTYDVFDFE